MLNRLILALICAAATVSSPAVRAQDAGDAKPLWMQPQLHGTIRAKYEYEPSLSKGRFEVRNCRVSLEGKVLPTVSYKAEVDLSDEGKIKMLDAWVKVRMARWVALTGGQMRVPFTIDAHRNPASQYFANRSFLAKQVGNVRDVGLAGALDLRPAPWAPLTLQAGIFNGSGITDQKDYWTGEYNFSAKASATLGRRWNVTASIQRATQHDTRVMMYDLGGYYQDPRWHVEAEWLHKTYQHGWFRPVNAVDAFAAYRIPVRGAGPLGAVSLLARWDYMGAHSTGELHDDDDDDDDDGEDDDATVRGHLIADHPRRQRITAGVTLHLGRGPLQADVRLNYEQYLYPSGAVKAVSERSKAVVELVCHF